MNKSVIFSGLADSWDNLKDPNVPMYLKAAAVGATALSLTELSIPIIGELSEAATIALISQGFNKAAEWYKNKAMEAEAQTVGQNDLGLKQINNEPSVFDKFKSSEVVQNVFDKLQSIQNDRAVRQELTPALDMHR